MNSSLFQIICFYIFIMGKCINIVANEGLLYLFTAFILFKFVKFIHK
jgi:hypothetical protein